MFRLKRFCISLFILLLFFSLAKGENLDTGSQLIKEESYSEAISFFYQVLKEDPTCLEAHLQLAGLYKQFGEFERAAKEYEEVLKLSPSPNTEALNALGEVYFYQKKYLYAEDMFRKALALGRPAVASDIHCNLGLLYQIQGKTSKALEEFNLAMESTPTDPIPYNNAASILAILGKREEAFNIYKKALKLNPNLGIVYFNLGNLYRLEGDWEKALMYYNRAFLLEPFDERIVSNLGGVFYHYRDFKKAFYYWQKAERLNPKNIYLKRNLALALFYQGKTEEAILHCKEALSCGNNNKEIFRLMAKIFLHSYKLKEALSYFISSI